MAENTFTKEITFKKLSFDPQNPTERKLEDITKMVTFNSLNQMDRSQHKFHGRLFAFFVMSPFGEEDKRILDTDGIYDLTINYVEKFVVHDAEFSKKDQELLLNDSTALFDLGLVFMKEVFTPFFLQSRMPSKK